MSTQAVITDAQIDAAARAINLDLNGAYEAGTYHTLARLALEAAAAAHAHELASSDSTEGWTCH